MDPLPSPVTNIFTVRACQLLCEQAIEHERNRTQESKELREICQGIRRELCRVHGKLLKLSTAVLDSRNEFNRGFDKLRGHVGGSETNMHHRFHGADAGIARIDMRLDATSEWLWAAIDAKIDGLVWDLVSLLRKYSVTESGWDDDDDDARKKYNQRLLASHEWTALQKAIFVHREKAHRALALELGLDYDRIQNAMNEKEQSTEQNENESEDQESADDTQEEEEEEQEEEEEEEIEVPQTRPKNKSN
ncbi:MAG: hypothetical protein Q9228_007315 [Teloschistes exilis]